MAISNHLPRKKTELVNHLGTTKEGVAALDAAQGKVLDDKITELKKSVSDGKKTVASAITVKGQATEQNATFQTMANNISKIQTGIDTSDATAISSDILSNKTAYTKGSKVTGSMSNYTNQTGKTNIANNCLMYRTSVWNDVNMLLDIKPGYYGGSYPIGFKVPNLTPENIKAGVQVSSNPASNSGLIGTFTNDATATASDIAQGKTAYVKGNKITGTLASGNVAAEYYCGETIINTSKKYLCRLAGRTYPLSKYTILIAEVHYYNTDNRCTIGFLLTDYKTSETYQGFVFGCDLPRTSTDQIYLYTTSSSLVQRYDITIYVVGTSATSMDEISVSSL